MNFLIIGRPNVGKSSIYNILTGQKKNIIHVDKGTTRDWHKDNIKFSNRVFVYDSPGIILNSNKKEEKSSINLINSKIIEIDYFLFVIDYKINFSIGDAAILKWLRKFNKKIILLINKKDNNKQILNTDYLKSGINDIFFLSCTHNLGFEKLNLFLKEKINYFLKENNESLDNINDEDFSVAIFGKPNAGKSTFLNKLLNYERSLTSEKAGTTTDYVVEYLNYKSKKIKIFDTVGIVKKNKINIKSIDFLAVRKSLNKIKNINSIIFLIDSIQGLDNQNKKIINLIIKKSNILILVFNKIDLIRNKIIFKKNVNLELQNTMHQLKNIKVFFISAYSRNQILKVFNYLFKINLNNEYNFNTSIINKWLKKCTSTYPHPLIDKKKVNFKYALIVKKNPLIIKIFCNQPKKIRKNYLIYLQNNFNFYFKVFNQTTKFIFTQSNNPYI